jgi:hypothetical protein
LQAQFFNASRNIEVTEHLYQHEVHSSTNCAPNPRLYHTILQEKPKLNLVEPLKARINNIPQEREQENTPTFKITKEEQ